MATIGIFDSGVGGLTVQKAILDRLPTLDTVYLGDTARVPYGSKSAEVVTQYSLRNARFLVAREVELLVVACNTASAVALPALRAALAIPVLGVVEPGARVAARATRSGRVGVIGTASTIASGAYQRALRAARPDVQVTSAACPLFVPLAEEGWRIRTTRSCAAVVAAVPGSVPRRRRRHPRPRLHALPAAEGRPRARAARGHARRQRRGHRRGGGRALPSGPAVPPRHRFFVTDTPDRFLAVAERFLGRPVDSAEQVDI